MHSDSATGKISRTERRRLKEVARIKGLLIEAKIELTDIDKEYKLPAGTAGNAVHEPHVAGERAIAAALKRRPEHLWFSRYSPDGQRMKPQPVENYRHARRTATISEAA